jgi:hypothetical protein
MENLRKQSGCHDLRGARASIRSLSRSRSTSGERCGSSGLVMEAGLTSHANLKSISPLDDKSEQLVISLEQK